MITSTRIGRYGNLCNSMFQFAAVIGMAKKCAHTYAIPYNESYFDVNYNCTNTSIFDGFDLDVHTYDGRQLLEEVEFPFHYIDAKIGNQTDMIGYFQSEKYFENAIEEVRAQFQFKEEKKEPVDLKIDIGDYPDPANTTSLHIRLGDYESKRDFHPAQPASYWQQAMEEAQLDNVVIFSDDKERAEKMFGGNKRVTYADEKDPFSALYHMSLCKNNILCNSTFGWWGAWLGEANTVDKVIVAPKLWFGPGHATLDPKDIIPERWLKL